MIEKKKLHVDAGDIIVNLFQEEKSEYLDIE
jgi:ribosomal silencing factor RsfS